MSSLHIVYASTSGHTEYVIGEVVSLLGVLRQAQHDIEVEVQRAEQTRAEDLLRGDVLLLACGTWNTGGVEGQLNPHMHAFLRERAKDIDLKGKQVAVIGLGDDRYHFTCRAADHLEEFVRTHHGILIEPTLRIINEPYGQEKIIKDWAKTFLTTSSRLRSN